MGMGRSLRLLDHFHQLGAVDLIIRVVNNNTIQPRFNSSVNMNLWWFGLFRSRFVYIIRKLQQQDP